MAKEKKMGRPTDNPKTSTIKVRLSESDLYRLDYAADKIQVSKSDIIRQGIEKVYNELSKS